MKSKCTLIGLLFFALSGVAQNNAFEIKVGFNKGTSPLDGGNPLGFVLYYDAPIKNKWSYGASFSYLGAQNTRWYSTSGPGGSLDLPLHFKEGFFMLDAGIRYNLSPENWRNKFKFGAGVGLGGEYLDFMSRTIISDYEVVFQNRAKDLAVYPLYNVFFEHDMHFLKHVIFFYRLNLSGPFHFKPLFEQEVENYTDNFTSHAKFPIQNASQFNVAVGFGYAF